VMTSAGSSIIASQNMIKKVYFPRLIIPLSKALVSLIDFGITFVFVIGLMIYYGITPTANLWFLPLFILMNIITALAFGIWASALSVRFRDVQQLIPFLVQLGVYITPVAYPSSPENCAWRMNSIRWPALWKAFAGVLLVVSRLKQPHFSRSA
jgi:lipopolysaccharide transport system permease protein